MSQHIRVDSESPEERDPHFDESVSPKVHAVVTRAVEDPRPNLARIAHLIQNDAALSGLVLEYVNSAAHALRCRVEHVDQAVALLGPRRLQWFLKTVELKDDAGSRRDAAAPAGPPATDSQTPM